MPEWEVSFGLPLDVNDRAILDAVMECEARLDAIREIPIQPAILRAFNTLNIARAVQGTTGLEGTQVSEEEVGRILDSDKGETVLPPNRQREEREVRNAADVMEYVKKAIQKRPDAPLTEDVIREIHRLTTEGISYGHNVPGQYRTHAVHAGSYTPPRDSAVVRSLMADFIKWFNEGPPKAWHPILAALVAHFYVVSIHPFGDGNGRASRGVESFLLYRAGVNLFGFYSLSNFYYRQRDAYVAKLMESRFEARSLTPFVRFALDGLVDEIRTIQAQMVEIMKRIAFRDYARETLEREPGLGPRRRERLLHLLQALSRFKIPLYAPREPETVDALVFGQYRKLSLKTLQRDLTLLGKHGFLTVEDGKIDANIDLMDKFTAKSLDI